MVRRRNLVVVMVGAVVLCTSLVFFAYSRIGEPGDRYDRNQRTESGEQDLVTSDSGLPVDTSVTISMEHIENRERGIFYPDLEIGDVLGWRALGKISTPEEETEKKQGEEMHAFNQLVSKRIGFARELPDTRPQLCSSVKYPPITALPTTSVIICFHNEDYTTLLRTVYMTLLNSPPRLIKEIILVDDASTMSELMAPLQDHVNQYLPKVRIERTRMRQGLIRARLMGARLASGDTITFLDSHCETNRGWLEPLLARLKEHPRSAVMPIIEIINQDTMEYQYISINLGGFNWDMVFKWDPMDEGKMSEEERIAPQASPTMAGGLFSMYREFFFESGSYDELMDVWGGENLEISFRLWMCADGVELIPCSKVGHIFRKRRPYDSPGGDSFGKNNKRLAEVWLDGYKEIVYKKKPYYRSYNVGSLKERQELRTRLNCRNFQWYLNNVYPKALEEIKKDPKLRTVHIGE